MRFRHQSPLFVVVKGEAEPPPSLATYYPVTAAASIRTEDSVASELRPPAAQVQQEEQPGAEQPVQPWAEEPEPEPELRTAVQVPVPGAEEPEPAAAVQEREAEQQQHQAGACHPEVPQRSSS